MMINADEFMSGQKACRNGELCEPDRSKSFVRGYSAQYEFEQVAEHCPRLARQIKKEVIL